MHLFKNKILLIVIAVSIITFGYESPHIKAHKHCIYHKVEISQSTLCGCFYCLSTFTPDKIENWIGGDNDDIQKTALCPYCEIDAVIGDKSGYPITEEFLKKMNKYWF